MSNRIGISLWGNCDLPLSIYLLLYIVTQKRTHLSTRRNDLAPVIGRHPLRRRKPISKACFGARTPRRTLRDLHVAQFGDRRANVREQAEA